MPTYKLLGKEENDRGVTLSFQKTETTFWGRMKAAFGGKPEETVSEFTVFYRISPLGTHFKTDMCYPDGSRVHYELLEKLLCLVDMAAFKEKPATQFEVDESL